MQIIHVHPGIEFPKQGFLRSCDKMNKIGGEVATHFGSNIDYYYISQFIRLKLLHPYATHFKKRISLIRTPKNIL